MGKVIETREAHMYRMLKFVKYPMDKLNNKTLQGFVEIVKDLEDAGVDDPYLVFFEHLAKTLEKDTKK